MCPHGPPGVSWMAGMSPMFAPVMHRRNGHPQRHRQGARGGPAVGARIQAGGQTGIRARCADVRRVPDPRDGSRGEGLVAPAAQPSGVDGGGDGIVGTAGGQVGDRVDHRRRRAHACVRRGAGNHTCGGGLRLPAHLYAGLAGRTVDRRQGHLRDEPAQARLAVGLGCGRGVPDGRQVGGQPQDLLRRVRGALEALTPSGLGRGAPRRPSRARSVRLRVSCRWCSTYSSPRRYAAWVPWSTPVHGSVGRGRVRTRTTCPATTTG